MRIDVVHAACANDAVEIGAGGRAILGVVKILMAHEDMESTDRYLRAIAIDTHVLADVLDTLLAEKHGR